MPEIKPTQHRPVSSVFQGLVYTYGAITGSDTTAPIAVGDMSEITVQAYGNFTGGGSVKIQGSNDPRVVTDPQNAVWFDATDSDGALSFSAAGAKVLKESPYFLRAVPTGTLAGVLLAISAKKMTK